MPIHDIINYFTFIYPFNLVSVERKGKNYKNYLENKRSLLDEIKNIFHGLRTIEDTNFNLVFIKVSIMFQ